MYSVLRIAGAPLAERIGWLHAEDPDGTLQRMRARLEEHEIRSFVLSRLVPAGRIPVRLAAALGGYPLGRFVTANVGAALARALMYGAIGLVGTTLIPDTRVAIGVVVVATLLIGVAPRLLRRKPKT